jgi:hypothetical protein
MYFIAVLVVVAFFISFFFVHGLAKPDENRSPAAPTEEDSDLPTAIAGSSMELKSTAPVSRGEQRDFQKQVRECFSRPELRRADSPESFLKNLVAQNPIRRSQFEMENTHVQLPDGSLRRIHVIPSDRTDQPQVLELRYFKLDEDGLPERIALPPAQTINPSPEFVQLLKSQGRVVFHQLKEHDLLKDGTQVALNQVDHKIYEMQIYSAHKTFSCHAMKCRCR